MTLAIVTDQFIKDLLNKHGFTGKYFVVDKFGFNPDVAATTLEDIWSEGGIISYLSAAETMSVVSDDAADDGNPAGTGLQKVMLEGLDTDWKMITEEVTLEGVTPVVTSKSFIRVDRMFGTDVGSGEFNAGKITATASIAGSVQASMRAGLGQSEKSQFSIPLGFVGILIAWGSSVGKADDFEARLLTREFGKCWRTRSVEFLFEDSVEHTFHGQFHLHAKSDIKVTAIGGNINRPIESEYALILVEDKS